MGITPQNSRDHKTLEQDVLNYLTSNGYLVCESTYHSTLSSEIIDILRNNFTPTGLYLRGRADRIAIHPETKRCFEWEAKTHVNPRRHDMTIEALPLCHHLTKNKLEVECLYVYRNSFKNHEVGFWVSSLPSIRCIMIPDRWSEDDKKYFTNIFKSFLPRIDIVYIEKTFGSDDPFIIIDESEIEKLSHWKDVIFSKGANP